MKNKKSIFKISGILALLIFILGFILTSCAGQNKTAAETTILQSETTTTTAETSSTEQLSEQPDKAKYDEYFTEFYLGKLPQGTDANPSNIPIKTAVFVISEDQFCTVWTQKKDIPSGSLSLAIYDTAAKKDFQPKTAFAMDLNSGGHMGSEPLGYPSGKYEYKVYIDNVLVVVIPFEVRNGEKTTETETTSTQTQGTEQLSEQPDKAKYDEYFTEFYLGKLPRGQQFGPYLGGKHFDPDNMPVKTAVFIASKDEFCGVAILKKDIPLGSFYISVYDAGAKKDVITRALFSQNLTAGDFGWAEDSIGFPTGKYEYKTYINDTLVVVIPFEVR